MTRYVPHTERYVPAPEPVPADPWAALERYFEAEDRALLAAFATANSLMQPTRERREKGR